MKRWIPFGVIADELINIGRARSCSRRPAPPVPGAEANFARSFLRRKVARKSFS
jgi:hypothetical protein